MTTEYLVQLSSPPVWTEENPKLGNSAKAGEIDGEEVWVSSGINLLDLDLEGKILWQGDGAGDMQQMDQSGYEHIRPLGNKPGGSATGFLDYVAVAGTGRRNMQVRTSESQAKGTLLYPIDNTPFVITTRHKEFFGSWPGWGWRAEMDYFEDDPSVRAIGVYTDPECTQYEYTTGAFIFGPSDWQVDDEGNPLDVWYTETPPGRAHPDKTDWNLAVLWASIQEGYATLSATQNQMQHLYWKENQGGGNNPGPADWTDTGQTVQGMGGTVVLVEDKSIFAVGQDIRIEDIESVITSVWDGGEGIILDPYHAYTTGSAIEYKQ